MAPSADDPHVWSGTLTPDQEGPWTLTIVNLVGSDPTCYEDVVLMVQDEAQAQTFTVVLFGLLVILGVLGGYWVMRQRRARSNNPAESSEL